MLSGQQAEILPCPPTELGAALELLYRRAPRSLRAGMIAEALDEWARGELDLSGLWIGRRRGRTVGALMTQSLAGRAAAVWAPEIMLTWGRDALADALLQAALNDLRAKGVRVAQALIDASSPPRGATDLARGGLPRVTELTYLSRETAPRLDILNSLPSFDWISYSPAADAEFRAVLDATYQGSLDMPELEGARSLDDILASHRAGGRFDPSRWQVGRLDGEPDGAAILLLAEPHDRDTWEVAYLGLTPNARGRGLGRVALAHALDLAHAHVPRLDLAVDVRNHPAERLYMRAGFVPYDRRAVHLAVL
jgi:GNAT superfamily N-acetyltransferase